jgi:hypothetical protein
MSAFFVSAEPDMSDLKPAKQGDTQFCTYVSVFSLSAKACSDTRENLWFEACNSIDFQPFQSGDKNFYKSNCSTHWTMVFNIRLYYTSPDYPNESDNASNKYSLSPEIREETSYSCPSDSFPDYTVLVNDNMCAKPKPKDCPAGYHSKAVSKALGSSECVPKECPPAGSGESLYTSPNLGSSFSGGGMYCNDGCAYSVSASNITSDKHATGTSQGAACGDKPYDNKKLADESDSDKCSTATNGDVTILSCADANPTTPEKDPHNNDDSKTPEDETPEKPKETCAEGDAACNLKNVETEIENSTNKQIDNDNKLHNKKVDAETKNTQAILNAMDSIDTSIFLQTKQDERLSAVTVSKFNELIDAVNGIETGGSGGGGGGNGDGSGGDCEGSPSECVPVEGAEIPNETVNLNEYADKYDDWLPNAELPSEKCIVLTNGKSICLSFEAFILLFQGISGLLVIGALMHSAKIISGAI